MKKELIGSIDRITEQTACIILNDDEHQLRIPLELLPDGADEGMAFTITIERNEEEEKRLAEEIATLKKASPNRRGFFFCFLRITSHCLSSDSDAAAPRQTQTNNDASGSPQHVAGRPPLPSVQVTVLYLTC